MIEIDYRLALPDLVALDRRWPAIKCWEGDVYSECKRDLPVHLRQKEENPHQHPRSPRSRPLDKRLYVIDGEPGYGENGREWPRAWYGLKGYFRWLESKDLQDACARLPLPLFS